jgi:hypothetical protein
MKAALFRRRVALALLAVAAASQIQLAAATASNDPEHSANAVAFTSKDVMRDLAASKGGELGLVNDPFWAHYPGDKKLYASRQTGDAAQPGAG